LLQVPVASWFDDMNDRELLDLIPFLENLSKVESVYSVLQQSKTGVLGSILPLQVTANNVAAAQQPALTAHSAGSPISSVTQSHENNSSSLKKNNNSTTTSNSVSQLQNNKTAAIPT
jgi:hypothetical protein